MKIVVRKNGNLIYECDLGPGKNLDFTCGRLQHQTHVPGIAVNIALCDLDDKFLTKLKTAAMDYRIWS